MKGSEVSPVELTAAGSEFYSRLAEILSVVREDGFKTNQRMEKMAGRYEKAKG